MFSTRSKLILDLVINKKPGKIIHTEDQIQSNVLIEEEYPSCITDVQLARSNQSSPLPIGADPDIVQKMQALIGDDVLSDAENQIQEDLPVEVQQQPDLHVFTQNCALMHSDYACILCTTTLTQSTNTATQNNVESLDTDQPESVVLQDHFLPSNALTPDTLIGPSSANSLHQNVDSPVLTPTLDNTPQPSVYCEEPDMFICPSSANSLHQNVESPILTPTLNNSPQRPLYCEEAEYQTPMPSPVNRHRNCQDPFCCQHKDKDVTQSIQNSGINSNQPSPVFLVRNRGKKRIRNHKDWGEVKRKRLTNEGKTYCSKRGHTVQGKTMREACRCRYKCADKISEDARKGIFEKFWALGDRVKQWLHIANYTKQEHKKRTYFARTGKHNRIYTYKYFLPKMENESHTKIEVCKIMFLNTLGITERMTRTAWQKYDGTISVENDLRGFHSNHKKVVDERMITSVCEHVKSFVPVESHYCRQSSSRLYLDGSLSIARMFILYKDWLNEERHENPAKTLRQYRDIVNSHFNLTFHIPKKDTCDQCHVFKNTENPSDELKVEYANHQHNKKVARQFKSKDKEDSAQSNGLIVCATFDLQKVLSCPHGQMSILYYKRKLSCYNLTVFDAAGKEGFCYVWDESVAKRGANEVASCLYDFIKTFAEKGTKEFRFWSDNCAGQNKNRIMFAMYGFVAEKIGVKITHRFLERGHTQNEGDSVHSVIERSGEHKVIYTPEEWKLLIRWAKTTDKPYQVRDVTQEDVFAFKVLLSNNNWTKNTTGQKVAWNKIREVVVEDNKNLQYRYGLDEDPMTLVIGKKTRNRGDNNIILKKAYSQPIPISTDKFKDLKSLADSGIIPSRYHNFFQGLLHGRVAEMESDSDE